MAQLDIQDLTFSYPGQDRRALEGVTLEIKRGSYACLCGRSGCGKTTLLRHLKTVLTPHGDASGSVFFEGNPLEKVSLRDQAQFIGFVMQDYALIEDFTAYENIVLPVEIENKRSINKSE